MYDSTRETTHDIALDRCDLLIDRYLRLKKSNQRKGDLAQLASLILIAVTPVLLLVPWDNVRIIAAATSTGAALSTGLLAIYNWRENYMRYAYAWQALQTEKYRYLTHSSEDYSDSNEAKAAQNFARRVEQLTMAEVADWRAEMQRVEQQPRN
jgi:hypothetical protein